MELSLLGPCTLAPLKTLRPCAFRAEVTERRGSNGPLIPFEGMSTINKLAPHDLLQADIADPIEVATVLHEDHIFQHPHFSRHGSKEGPGLSLSLWFC